MKLLYLLFLFGLIISLDGIEIDSSFNGETLSLQNEHYFIKQSITVKNLYVSACANITFVSPSIIITVENGLVNIGEDNCPIFMNIQTSAKYNYSMTGIYVTNSTVINISNIKIEKACINIYNSDILQMQ